MTPTVKQLKHETLDFYLENSKDNPRNAPYDMLDNLASTNMTPGCKRLFIPYYAEFNALDDNRTIPKALSEQILGKVYREGFMVEHEGVNCVVVKLSLYLSTPIIYQKGDKVFIPPSASICDTFQSMQIVPGKIIPNRHDISIYRLTLIDADQINYVDSEL